MNTPRFRLGSVTSWIHCSIRLKFVVAAVAISTLSIVAMGLSVNAAAESAVNREVAAHLHSVAHHQSNGAMRWLTGAAEEGFEHVEDAPRSAFKTVASGPTQPGYDQAVEELSEFIHPHTEPGEQTRFIALVGYDDAILATFGDVDDPTMAAGSKLNVGGAKEHGEFLITTICGDVETGGHYLAVWKKLPGFAMRVVSLVNLTAMAQFAGEEEIEQGATTMVYVAGHGMVTSTGIETPPEHLEELFNSHQEFKAVPFQPEGGPELAAQAIEAANAPWTMVATIPADIAFRELNRLSDVILIMVVIITLLTILAAWWFGRRFTRPISALAREVEALGRGDLSARVQVHGGDEIGVLAAAFNNAAQELQSTHQELTQEKEFISAIQDSMGEGLVAIDRDGVIAFANAAAATIFPLGAREDLGRRYEDVIQAARDCCATDQQHQRMENLLDPEGFNEPVEIDIKWPTPAHLQITPFGVESGGETVLTCLLVRDTTKEYEVSLQRDAFISVASHELRTPMTAVLAFAELALSPTFSEEKRMDALRRIDAGAKRLSAIVDDMLDVSRIQSGRLELNMDEVSVSDAVETAMASVQGIVKTHQVETDVEPNLEVHADREKLAQIMTNLTSNAIKYSPAGGQVTVGAEQFGTAVHLWVRDQGLGIAEDQLDQVFDAFHRIRRPETSTTPGTGLGLHIVKSLVELMSGGITVESTINVGTVFHVYLPAAGESELNLSMPPMCALKVPA